MSPDAPDAVARIIDSGVLDLEFYQALRGRTWSATEQAAEDVVSWAMPNGVLPVPGADFFTLPQPVRRAWRRGRAGPLADHLATRSPAALSPETRERMLALARVIGGGGPALDDWSLAGGDRRRTGQTSIVVSGSTGRRPVLRAVKSVLEHVTDRELEVVIADGSLSTADVLSLAAALLPRGVDIVPVLDGTPLAAARNAGVVRTTGEHIVLLHSSSVVRPGWLGPLLSVLADPDVVGVQPLLLNEDETIAAAGYVHLAPDLLPAGLLRGHQRDEALPLADERLVAVSAAAMVVRAVDLVEERGFDVGYSSSLGDIDLCLRLGRKERSFRVEPDVVVTTRVTDDWGLADRQRFAATWAGRLPVPDAGVYDRLGLSLDQVTSDEAPVPAARPVLRRDPERPPGRLRWSVRLPSTRGAWGDRWGDTHFANALARALRELGQQVVTCRRGAHDAGPTHLDDVVLAIRGRLPIAPTAGKTNVLWVISHPEDVQPAELAGFDLVLAASLDWSRRMAEVTGRAVVPLFQASEFGPCDPVVLPAAARREVVFVGSTHDGRRRRLVEAAVASGVPLAVYGSGWEGVVPARQWKADYVANEDLPDLYRRHGIVLADHWPDMARHGFVANRVFDALAVGARVICDDVVGLHEMFPSGAVAVCRSPQEIRTAVDGWDRHGVDVAGAVDLSFSGRAETLLTMVLATHAGKSARDPTD